MNTRKHQIDKQMWIDRQTEKQTDIILQRTREEGKGSREKKKGNIFNKRGILGNIRQTDMDRQI